MGDIIQMGPKPIKLARMERAAVEGLMARQGMLSEAQRKLQEDDREIVAEIFAAHGLPAEAANTTHGFDLNEFTIVPLPQAAAQTSPDDSPEEVQKEAD